MRKPKELLESLVIHDCLDGKPSKQIAMDNNTSTGNISNITNQRKNKIGKLEAEEFRQFILLVKKIRAFNRTMRTRFRIAQLMNNLVSKMTMKMVITVKIIMRNILFC